MRGKFRTKNKEAQIQAALEILREFCSESTIHGVRYFTEPRTHWLERLWWVAAFIVSALLCGMAIFNIWNDWRIHPVIVTFDDKTTSISEIPFPSVTVCSTQKYKHEVLDLIQYRNAYLDWYEHKKDLIKLLPAGEIEQLDTIVQTCLRYAYNTSEWSDEFIPKNYSIYKTIKEIAPDEDTVVEISLFGALIEFEPIYTDGGGLCYSFTALNSMDIYSDEIAPELITVINNPNATNWNAEGGYKFNVQHDKEYPRRLFDSALADMLYLELVISLYEEEDKYCDSHQERVQQKGLWISLNMPDDIPRFSKNFMYIPVDYTVYISIRPNVMITLYFSDTGCGEK